MIDILVKKNNKKKYSYITELCESMKMAEASGTRRGRPR